MKSSQVELEDLPSLSESSFQGGIANVFDMWVARWPWHIITDFHQMLRSRDFIDEMEVDAKLRGEMAKAEKELEKLFRSVKRD